MDDNYKAPLIEAAITMAVRNNSIAVARFSHQARQ
jgi:hypothetical protein